MTLQPFHRFPAEARKRIRFVLADIDDTLTFNGRLPSASLRGMERLQAAGIRMVPITGRPAGWCDHIARMWPVEGLVGENGAFYFRYDDVRRQMLRRYVRSSRQRRDDRVRLDRIGEQILKQVPGCRISADQAYREADLAVDFREDVPALSMDEVRKIVLLFEQGGARAKISSIHVNGWFGDHDKLTTTRLFFSEVFGMDLDLMADQVVFVGDSPNDCPMFAFFPHSVGVANVLDFRGVLTCEPAWVTRRPGGHGFAEMVEGLLS